MIEYCLPFPYPPFPKTLFEILFVKKKVYSNYFIHNMHFTSFWQEFLLELWNSSEPQRLYHVMANIFKLPSSHYHDLDKSNKN